jgi:hypothetical protein
MAHKSGHKMQMGSKEKNTPGNFSEKDTKTISQSTQGKLSNEIKLKNVTITAKKGSPLTDKFMSSGNTFGNRLNPKKYGSKKTMSDAVNKYSKSEGDFVKNVQGYNTPAHKSPSDNEAKALYKKYKK